MEKLVHFSSIKSGLPFHPTRLNKQTGAFPSKFHSGKGTVMYVDIIRIGRNRIVKMQELGWNMPRIAIKSPKTYYMFPENRSKCFIADLGSSSSLNTVRLALHGFRCLWSAKYIVNKNVGLTAGRCYDLSEASEYWCGFKCSYIDCIKIIFFETIIWEIQFFPEISDNRI